MSSSGATPPPESKGIPSAVAEIQPSSPEPTTSTSSILETTSRFVSGSPSNAPWTDGEKESAAEENSQRGYRTVVVRGEGLGVERLVVVGADGERTLAATSTTRSAVPAFLTTLNWNGRPRFVLERRYCEEGRRLVISMSAPSEGSRRPEMARIRRCDGRLTIVLVDEEGGYGGGGGELD